MRQGDRTAARGTRKAHAGADDEDDAQEAALRMLERGIDPSHPSHAGFQKNVHRENVRRANRECVTKDGAAPEGATSGDVSMGNARATRARPRRCYSEAELRAALEAHVAGVLADWTGREWRTGDSAELRDAIGADGPWPVIMSPKGERRAKATREGGWRVDTRPALLALRRAVIVEVEEHGALGRRRERPTSTVLAAVSVVCGDEVKVHPAEYEEGVTPGAILDQIAAGFGALRTKDAGPSKKSTHSKKSTRR